MVKKSFSVTLLFITVSIASVSQEALKYQLPPDEIVRIVDAPVTPMVSVSPDKTNILLIERPPIITISELSARRVKIRRSQDQSCNKRSEQADFQQRI